MSDKAKGPLRRACGFIWRSVTALRRGLANLIFIAILAVVVIALVMERELKIEPGSTLLLAPTGEVVQQRSFIDPLARFLDPEALEAETPLQDLIDAVNAAQADARIDAILLDLRNLAYIDISSTRELGAALARFRQAGKKVIAEGDSFDQADYLLASYADEIYLHTMGMVGIRGFGVYTPYLKELLDRLRIDVHVFRVGQYKAAVEPFMRNDMSDAARQNNLGWLQSLWANYTGIVAQNRGLEAAAVHEYADQFDDVLERVHGDAAQAALDYGLVDQVLTREDMRERIRERLHVDDLDEDLVHFYDYLDNTDRAGGQDDAKDAVAVVVAEGVIVDGEQPPGMAGGDSVAALLREAREDDHVKAVVLRIDSEGGSAFASEIIREQVKLLQQAGKPVVASMGSVAASGGYWIASGADEIWAQPTTITGSIGIFGVYPSIYRALSQWGIHTDGVGTAALAEGFRVDRPLPEAGSRALQSMIEEGYQRFIKLVAESRGLSVEAVEKVAQGQVWSGEDARHRGLVDQFGGLDDAVAAAAGLAKLEHYRTRWFSDESWLESSLWDRLWGVSAGMLEVRLRRELLGGLAGLARWPRAARELPLFNDPAGVYVQCLQCRAH
jgi:protease-4